MVDRFYTVGDTGELWFDDQSGDPSNGLVRIYLKHPTAIYIPAFIWWTVIDGLQSVVNSTEMDLLDDEWLLLGGVFAAGKDSFTFLMGDSGTTEFNGPAQFQFTLASSEGGIQELAFVKDNGVWKRAVPYVNDGGAWKVARPYIKRPSGWVSAI